MEYISATTPLGNSNKIIAKLYADWITKICDNDIPFEINSTVKIECGKLYEIVIKALAIR